MAEIQIPKYIYKPPTEGVADIVNDLVCHLTCQVVERQEQVIMGTIQRIAGEEFKEFTIDKHKVVDAFKRTIPAKFRPAVDNSIVMAGFCPTCGGSVEVEKTWTRKEKGACCSWCGQRLDLKDLFDD